MPQDWIQKQTLSPDHRAVTAPSTHDLKDFTADPSGFYVLVKILPEKESLAVAVCDARHRIVRTFEGRTARDLWTAIFREEEASGAQWFTRKDHAAYLGKELAKAEAALATGSHSGYRQE